ncbi:MAG: FHA domain-containing protein [Myxococcales bacterium]|nr:FHA domain-containing protein [Myxococcales bacterium]
MELVRLGDKRTVSAALRTGVGRGVHNLLRTDHPASSGAHAILQWGPDGWTVRDLGSRNGTLVNGELVSARQARPCGLGDVLIFGNAAESWQVVQADKVRAVVRRLAPEATIEVRGDSVTLPADGASRVLQRESGAWILKESRGSTSVVPGVPFWVAGAIWTLWDCSERDRTLSEDPREGDRACLTLSLARDEESAALRVECTNGAFDVDYRAHSCVLAPLVVARLKDQRAGVSPADAGWVHWSFVAEWLRCSQGDVNTWVYRTRRALARAGYPDAPRIVERRQTSGLLRVGARRLSLLRATG